MASTESGIPSLSESRSWVAVRAPIVDVVALRLRVGAEGHTDRRGGQRRAAGERREAARGTDRLAAATGPRMANEVRRGCKPLLDVAVPAQGRPPGEGQHVVAEAHQAPACECAGDDDAEQ